MYPSAALSATLQLYQNMPGCQHLSGTGRPATQSGGIAGRLQDNGIAVLSGILQGQEDEVIAALQHEGLVVREILHDGTWVSLAAGREISLADR